MSARYLAFSLHDAAGLAEDLWTLGLGPQNSERGEIPLQRNETKKEDPRPIVRGSERGVRKLKQNRVK